MDKRLKWWLAGLVVVLTGMAVIGWLTQPDPATPAPAWRPDYTTELVPLWPARGNAASDKSLTDAAAVALRNDYGTPTGDWGLLWAEDADDDRVVFAVPPSTYATGHDIYQAVRDRTGDWYVSKVGSGVDLAQTPAIAASLATTDGHPIPPVDGQTIVATDVRAVRAYCDDGGVTSGTVATGTITWTATCPTGSRLVAFDRAAGTSYVGGWSGVPVDALLGGASPADLLALTQSSWAVAPGLSVQVTLLDELRLPDGTPGRLLSMTRGGAADVAWVPAIAGGAATISPASTIRPGDPTHAINATGHPPVLVVLSAGPATVTPPQPVLASGAGYLVLPAPTSPTAIVATDAAGVPTDTVLVGRN